MTPQEAVAILERLKDNINDPGKVELSAVQKAINLWMTFNPIQPDPEDTIPCPECPAPKPEKKKAPAKKAVAPKAKAKKKKK